MLAHCEAVIAAETGHINVHEAGAIEFTGHRVISLPSHQGLMKAEDLEAYMDWFVHDESTEHLAQPGMVYITYPSELGTIYHQQELAAIHEICRKYDLKLYEDGARWATVLAAEGADIHPVRVWPALSDAFYIGGTKVGALCRRGSVVFPRGNAPRHFFSIIQAAWRTHGQGPTHRDCSSTHSFTDGLYLPHRTAMPSTWPAQKSQCSRKWDGMFLSRLAHQPSSFDILPTTRRWRDW
jgi:threonine aldolase